MEMIPQSSMHLLWVHLAASLMTPAFTMSQTMSQQHSGVMAFFPHEFPVKGRHTHPLKIALIDIGLRENLRFGQGRAC